MSFAAVVLAGERGGIDPVAAAAGVSCKAFVPLGGRPMVLRVLDALGAADGIGPPLLVGPARERLEGCAELVERLEGGDVRWLEPAASPASSALRALDALEGAAPVLLTTADHALLSPRVLEHFCAAARASGHDVVAAVAEHEQVVAAFPEARRTVLRFRGDSLCGCNLFAFLTPGAREIARLWRRVEAARKRPLRAMRVLGWTAVLRYALGRLTLDQALAHLSRRTGLSLGVVRMPFPEAAVDVDTPADLALVRARLEEA